MEIFLTRQPIFDRAERLVAFELRYAQPDAVVTDDVDAAFQAERVLLDACLGQGLDQVAEGKAAFLRVSRSMLTRGAVRVVHPRRVVLQFGRGISADPDLIAACDSLIKDGYQFAIDFDDALRLPALVQRSRLVKLDAATTPVATNARRVAAFHGHGVRVLADGVPNRTVRDQCFATGIDLLGGYDFVRPEVLARRDVGIDHAQAFRLLKIVRDPNSTDAAVEEALRRDLALTYKLLRLVNSASMGAGGIHTIGHAIRLVGRTALARWLSLLLISGIAERGVELEIANTSLARAYFCEKIAEAYGIRQAGGSLFMVGLFSLLDTLLGEPMDDLVERLELAPDVSQALIAREDFYGAVLSLVEAYEAGAWKEVTAQCEAFGITPDLLPKMYVDAIQWARTQLQETLVREADNQKLLHLSSRPT